MDYMFKVLLVNIRSNWKFLLVDILLISNKLKKRCGIQGTEIIGLCDSIIISKNLEKAASIQIISLLLTAKRAFSGKGYKQGRKRINIQKDLWNLYVSYFIGPLFKYCPKNLYFNRMQNNLKNLTIHLMVHFPFFIISKFWFWLFYLELF